MNAESLETFATRFLDAWNSCEVEKVLACYTDDLVYRDPNSRKKIEGAQAMRSYVTELFREWDMKWFLKEAYSIQGADGAVILWRSTFCRQKGRRTAEVHGMDIVFFEGERISRNEVYFDRLRLLPLVGLSGVFHNLRKMVGV